MAFTLIAEYMFPLAPELLCFCLLAFVILPSDLTKRLFGCFWPYLLCICFDIVCSLVSFIRALTIIN